MDSFYIIVLSIAVILLIIILTYIGIAMTNKKGKTAVFPPQQSVCPDYWESDMTDMSSCRIPSKDGRNAGTTTKDANGRTITSIYDSNGTLLLNSSNTNGFVAPSLINFNSSKWDSAGSSALCAKRDWANTFGIVWDGVSNYNGCQ